MTSKESNKLVIPDELVLNKIYLNRNQKVMLDSDLAELYQVETKALNQQVKRNLKRFPADFMFQLTTNEWDVMRSQFVTAYPGKVFILKSSIVIKYILLVKF